MNTIKKWIFIVNSYKFSRTRSTSLKKKLDVKNFDTMGTVKFPKTQRDFIPVSYSVCDISSRLDITYLRPGVSTLGILSLIQFCQVFRAFENVEKELGSSTYLSKRSKQIV